MKRLLAASLALVVSATGQKYGAGNPTAWLEGFGTAEVLIIVDSNAGADGFVYSLSGTDAEGHIQYRSGYIPRGNDPANFPTPSQANGVIFPDLAPLRGVSIGVWEESTVGRWGVTERE